MSASYFQNHSLPIPLTNSSQNSLTCLNNHPQSQPISTKTNTPPRPVPDFLLTALSLSLSGSRSSTARPRSQTPPLRSETLDAFARAVREELGSIIGDSCDLRIVPNSYAKKVEERVSVSYPGLPAFYALHSVDACVGGLPDGEFCTEEGEEYENSEENKVADKAISCKKHYWKWVDSDSASF
ncbi:hypothetical protein Acr_18g0005520 [Actinidia rufa]|uniref:Uncharacterized protein n=1 Tax=Actinidia rufa TaxID=165716 RepID=A0A7J0G6M4_9ERIC|nr:hypothetical protein Acr_18g0005520 [Actinidia rufa]